MTTALYSTLLVFLGMTSVFAFLLLLHGVRKLIGSAAFYIMLGVIFVLMQLAGTSGIYVDSPFPGMDFELLSLALSLPFLGALMIIYITDGTLEAQRVILGSIAALFLYLYLVQLAGSGIVALESESTGELDNLMSRSLRPMAAAVTAFAVDIFLIPIMFQALRNLKCRLFYALTGALVIVQLCDAVIYSMIRHLGSPDWWQYLLDTSLIKLVAVLWLGTMSSVYLMKLNHNKLNRATLDILFAFFGNYGKTKELEKDLRRTEERYKLLFENAVDMVIVLDLKGRILQANQAALKMMEIRTGELDQGIRFQDLAESSEEFFDGTGQLASVNMKRSGKKVELTFSKLMEEQEEEQEQNPQKFQFVVFGRDVTERMKLRAELDLLRTKAEHDQRLESIGKLAGGIAHDFNNYLHAIQGHLDIIRYMHPTEDENISRNLDKIDAITGKAALLTKQMLGFARKGNYTKTSFDPAQLIKSTIELFMPGKSLTLDTAGIKTPSPFIINGDMIQIQQTLLNLLINARDAMENLPERERMITLELFAMDDSFRTDPPRDADFDPQKKYCVIRIADSGSGIPEEVQHRILEPFFTTKPVGRGTGMGLSMAYGAMLSHHGWLQFHNGEKGGAVFELIFPLEK